MNNPASVATVQRKGRSSEMQPGLTRGAKPILVRTGHSSLLDAALRRISAVSTNRSNEHWIMRTPGIKKAARADLSADWLSISLSLRRLSATASFRSIDSMLARNARIGATTRIVGRREPGTRQIVVDIPAGIVPWDNEAELDALLVATLAALNVAASRKLRCGDTRSADVPPSEDFVAVCADAGWPAQSTDARGIDVPLEVPGQYLVASVSSNSAATRFTVDFPQSEMAAASQNSRNAAAILLWLTSSRIRMVKAMRVRRGFAIETSLPSVSLGAIGVDHACAALSLALQQCAAEAQLLIANDELARIYLLTLGFSTST